MERQKRLMQIPKQYSIKRKGALNSEYKLNFPFNRQFYFKHCIDI